MFICFHYLISATSNGTLNSINNQVGGACKDKNMRLILDFTGETTTRGKSVA